jgi:hypothetical protein
MGDNEQVIAELRAEIARLRSEVEARRKGLAEVIAERLRLSRRAAELEAALRDIGSAGPSSGEAFAARAALTSTRKDGE